MKDQTIHFDSIKSTYINYTTNTTQNVLNSGFSKFTIKDRIENIKSISLKSFEIPIYFLNIRTGSTSTFSFILNTVTYNLNLSENNYTTIDSLITDINTMILTYVALALVTIVLTINSLNKVLISYLPICISINLSINKSVLTYLSSHLSVYLSMYEPIYLSIYLSVYLSVYLCLSINQYLSICQHIYLSTFYLPIYLFIS